jgi:hypothetical protein
VRVTAAIAGAVLVASLLALAAQIAREVELRALATNPELADLPDLARARRRLISTRTRRGLSRELRHVAASQPHARVGPSAIVPVLHDRVAAVRDELLDVATALEHGNPSDHDPVRVARIRELLRDGASPLYNPNVAAAGLYTTLSQARSGLAIDPWGSNTASPPDAEVRTHSIAPQIN